MTTQEQLLTIAAGAVLAFVAYKTLFSGKGTGTGTQHQQAILRRTGNNKLADLAQTVFTSGLPGSGNTGPLWPDTEAAYQGTWTANGPLNLANYNKQIWD